MNFSVNSARSGDSKPPNSGVCMCLGDAELCTNHVKAGLSVEYQATLGQARQRTSSPDAMEAGMSPMAEV